MADEELQRRLQFLERKLAQMEDEAAIQRRKDAYTMATLGKRNLQNNVTMDLMFAGNLVWNSSFEMPSVGVLPTYWTGGVSSAEQAFVGTVSLKLTTGQSSEQTSGAYIPVAAFGGEKVRVTFAQLGGMVRCEIIDQSGIAMLSDDFNLADSWYNGRRTMTVKPGTATSVHLRFTNIDSTNAVYIDAVQVEADILKKWPSLYTDGPKSGAYASEATGGSGGSGAIPTLLVAASTASAKIKAAADYVCDGVDDQVEINAAIAALPPVSADLPGSRAGRVVLTEGTFNVSDAVQVVYCAQLSGMGPGTILLATIAMPAVVILTATCVLRDLLVDGASLALKGLDGSYDGSSGADESVIDSVAVTGCTAVGVHVDWTGTGYRTWSMSNCRSYNNLGSGFECTGGTITACRADSNGGDGFVLHFRAICSNCQATDNTTGAGFLLSTFSFWHGVGLTVNGCTAVHNRNGIKMDDVRDSVICNNQVWANREHGIYLLNDCHRNLVANNQCQQNSAGDTSTFRDPSFHNTYSNIEVAVASNENTISGNVCRMESQAGDNWSKYGINIASGARNWVANNNCYQGGNTAGIADSGTGTIRDPGNILRLGTWSNLTG